MKCLICHRVLKDPVSIARQMGPTCFGKSTIKRFKQTTLFEESGKVPINVILDTEYALRKRIDILERKLTKHKDELDIGRLAIKSIANCTAYKDALNMCEKCAVLPACVVVRKRKEDKKR